MTEILRGQQGYPTGTGRGPAGPVDRNDIPDLPGATEWRRPDQAEAAIEATREALARSRGLDQPRPPTDSTDLVREAEQIEDDVAPGRETGDDEPPSEASTHD